MVKHCVNDGKERKIEINSISRMLNGVNFYWIKSVLQRDVLGGRNSKGAAQQINDLKIPLR